VGWSAKAMVYRSRVSMPPATRAQKQKCRQDWRHHVCKVRGKTGRLVQARHQR
jgi:hypothetical protein